MIPETTIPTAGAVPTVPVCVGIPTFARGEKVLAVIGRILACDPRPAEILVHVDASDGALERRLAQIPEVRVLSSTRRVGPGGGRHRLLMAASAPFFFSFDDDSYPVDAGFFAEVVRLFANEPGAAVLEAVITHPEDEMAPARPRIATVIAFTGCGHAMRVAVYRSLAGYVDRAVPYGIEEPDVGLQMHAAGWKILRCHSLRVYHDTARSHHQNPGIVAGSIQNVALLAWLRYPVRLWPWVLLQVGNKTWDCIRRGRHRGILGGLAGIPLVVWQYRHLRRALPAGTIRSYLALCREHARRGAGEAAAAGRVLLVHPGTQYAHRLAGELARRRLLLRFWTTFLVPDGGFWGRVVALAPRTLRRRLGNRRLPGVPPGLVRLRPWLEARALWRMRGSSLNGEAVLHARNRRLQEIIPDAELHRAGVVVGFDTSSWILVERCRRLQRRFILDQSIAHPRAKERIYGDLRRRFPEWREDFVVKPDGLLACEELEHRQADRIVAASSFTKGTLVANGVPEGRVSVIPYGVDLAAFHPAPRAAAAARPLRFVFVGLVNARKGIPLLLDVWRRLAPREAELWVVGRISPRVRPLIPELPRLRLLGARPHHELPGLLRECDVMVFPSFFEGFGLVILEAMACGLPVITTDATAGPDVLTPDSGIVVPAGDGPALGRALEFFLRDPRLAPTMGSAARRRAEQFTWGAYGDRWRELLCQVTATVDSRMVPAACATEGI